MEEANVIFTCATSRLYTLYINIPVVYIFISDMLRIPRFLDKGSTLHLGLEPVIIRRTRFCNICSLDKFFLRISLYGFRI